MQDRLLDDWIDTYLEYTEISEPSRMYRLWSAIAVIAGCLQRKCRLNWGSLTFYPNMYIVFVGPPAARKGTAMDQGFFFLDKLNIKVAAEAITREMLIRDLKNSNDNDMDIKTGKMIFHSSLTIWSQELTVFLGYNNMQLLSDLTDWYDCRNKWVYRTKHEGVDDIVGVFVNLCGATTPELIRSMMPLNAIGGGLTSRMIFIFEFDKGKVVPYTHSPEELENKLLSDLEKIRMMSGRFSGTDAFMELWVDWYIEANKNPPFKDSRFDGYMQRRGNHIMKLSMILNASRTGDMIITDKDLQRAIDVLNMTEKKMLNTFSGVGKAPLSDVMAKVMVDISMSGEDWVLFSELLDKYKDDADDWGMEKIMKTLEKSKWVKRKDMPGDTAYKYVPKTERKKENERGEEPILPKT